MANEVFIENLEEMFRFSSSVDARLTQRLTHLSMKGVTEEKEERRDEIAFFVQI